MTEALVRPAWATKHPLLTDYYDTEWGMPVRDERGVFERLSLEAFQSGLSWVTILKKRENFRAAFANFEVDIIAAFSEEDRMRLLEDAGIVRNGTKIDATIRNARATQQLRASGGLSRLIWSHQPAVTPMPKTLSDIPVQSEESVALSRALKKHGFTFVGPVTMFALMEAIGIVDTHLMSSHRRGSSGIWPNDKAGPALRVPEPWPTRSEQHVSDSAS